MENNKDKFELKIITHEKIIIDDMVDALYIQATDGHLGILKNHVPIICALKVGVGKFIKDNESSCFTAMGGILQFENNKATILTDIAELSCDIDEIRAKHELERAKAILQSKEDDLDIVKAQMSLSKAIARLHAKNNHY